MGSEEVAAKISERQGSMGKLLKPHERNVCTDLLSAENPHNQRAQALLALDDGSTQKEAGLRSGLTLGQVRYSLRRFRKMGLEIFPSELIDQKSPQPEIRPEPEHKEAIKPDGPEADEAGSEKVQELEPQAAAVESESISPADSQSKIDGKRGDKDLTLKETGAKKTKKKKSGKSAKKKGKGSGKKKGGKKIKGSKKGKKGKPAKRRKKKKGNQKTKKKSGKKGSVKKKSTKKSKKRKKGTKKK